MAEKINYNEKEPRQELETELNDILPGVEFTNDAGYKLSYKGVKLDMSFIDFESLKEAIKIIAEILRIYKVNGKVAEFYVYAKDFPEIVLDNSELPTTWLYNPDTTYLNRLTSAFLGRRNYVESNNQRSLKPIVDELKKLADFLNAIKDKP